MSRLNSKLVLKAIRTAGVSAGKFEVVKATNTLEHGIPGDELTRETVDKILKDANTTRPGRGTLTVEFVK